MGRGCSPYSFFFLSRTGLWVEAILPPPSLPVENWALSGYRLFTPPSPPPPLLLSIKNWTLSGYRLFALPPLLLSVKNWIQSGYRLFSLLPSSSSFCQELDLVWVQAILPNPFFLLFLSRTGLCLSTGYSPYPLLSVKNWTLSEYRLLSLLLSVKNWALSERGKSFFKCWFDVHRDHRWPCLSKWVRRSVPWVSLELFLFLNGWSNVLFCSLF